MNAQLLITALLVVGLPLSLCAQQWHSRISINSQLGYATNSYLNDYLSEWEPSLSAPYGVISPRALFYRNTGKNAVNASGGIYYQPYLQSGYSSWRGGYVQAEFDRRLNRSLYTGIRAGGNWYHYTYARKMGWIEPYVRWNLSEDMEAQFSWSNTFRDYDELEADSSTKRYSRMALDYKWWPTYRFELQLGAYSNIQQLYSGDRFLSGYLESTYWFRNDWNLKLHAGYEHYGFKRTLKRSVGPRCDVYKGCSVNNLVRISSEDDMYTMELSSTYEIDPNWSVSISASTLRWVTEDAERNRSTTDAAFSLGVTYSIVPDWGSREQIQAPSIRTNKDESTLFTIRYKGEANLYLTGEFNNWNRPGIPLIKGPGDRYRTSLNLQQGVYEYKILKLKGGETEWLKLSDNAVMVRDGFGGMNGRMVIE